MPSCLLREGANNVDARTVTAFDVITAFAAPDSNFSLRNGRSLAARKSPCQTNHSAYFGSAKFY